MQDQGKTKEQLIDELHELRQRLSDSEEDKAEENRAEWEAIFRLTFNNLREGLLLTDQETKKFLMGNPAIQEMLCYGAEELNHIGIADIHPEQDLPWVMNQFERLAKGVLRIAPEVAVRRKDGSVFHADISSSFPLIFNGRDCVMGVFRNITERKQAEETLRDSEAKYRRIVDTANEGIWSVDGNFITTFVNSRMAWMLGYDESEMIGRPVHWFMFEQDRADLREKMRDRRTGISDRYERRYRHKDGRSVWFILSVTPLVDDKGGSFKGSFAMVTDISERKHMEEELLKSRHELELRVRERTAELERVNSQLRSVPSKLIAVQEDERKRIAGELHDSVGQTLAALKYGIETVLVKKHGGDLAGAFNLLERFVPTLQRSIDETRGIYMGLRPPMLDSLGLLATLEWFCREFQSLHSSHRLELETKIKEEEIPDTVKITIFRIAQEALNNAAKHSQAKRVNLLLTKSRSSIELTVKDDGEGFELDSVLSDNGLKSLGLVGMMDRAKLGGGTFSIESTPGKGTVLRASWPT